MEAGRELDAEVAVRVMGYGAAPLTFNPEQVVYLPPEDFRHGADDVWWLGRDVRELVPHYSTSIADAWEVVEHLDLSVMRSANGWVAGILVADYPENGWVDCEIEHYELADTAPLAICRAALAAVSAVDLMEPER